MCPDLLSCSQTNDIAIRTTAKVSPKQTACNGYNEAENSLSDFGFKSSMNKNRSELVEFLRFYSTKSPEEQSTLMS